MVIFITLVLLITQLGISREQIISVVKNSKGEWQVGVEKRQKLKYVQCLTLTPVLVKTQPT